MPIAIDRNFYIKNTALANIFIFVTDLSAVELSLSI